MGQDIRDMLKDTSLQNPKLPEGHEARFAKKLEESFQQKPKNTSFLWLKVAAAVIIFMGLGYFAYQFMNGNSNDAPILADTETVEENTPQEFTLGDLSPDLKKVEDFYTTGIKVQLASLESDPENKDLIDAYMKRLNELNQEYARLNKEMNEVGPTEATITALVDNLKLRLELLFKLKNKLKELKQLENEKYSEFTT
ncbi:MAG: hypothetical protein AAF466_09135 [Bacteroidota bacterium]